MGDGSNLDWFLMLIRRREDMGNSDRGGGHLRGDYTGLVHELDMMDEGEKHNRMMQESVLLRCLPN